MFEGCNRISQLCSRQNTNSYLLTAPSNNEDPSGGGSPYSPSGASFTDNSYNSLPRNTTNSILKNGSLRSRSKYYQHPESAAAAASTVLRPMKYSQHYDNNGYGYSSQNTTSFTNYNSSSPSHHAYNNDNGFVYEHTYSNGNVASSTALLDSEVESEQLNSCLKKKPNQSLSMDVLDTNNTKNTEEYPIVAKPSPSLQIIATRNRPCCECIRYNQRAPLCLLFLIFIVLSCSLITGVMFYLKSSGTKLD